MKQKYAPVPVVPIPKIVAFSPEGECAICHYMLAKNNGYRMTHYLKRHPEYAYIYWMNEAYLRPAPEDLKL